MYIPQEEDEEEYGGRKPDRGRKEKIERKGSGGGWRREIRQRKEREDREEGIRRRVEEGNQTEEGGRR